MPNTIVIPVNSATEAYNMVLELKAMGLVANKDFTWSFKPRHEDYITYETIDPPSVQFTFINESLLSWAELKWG